MALARIHRRRLTAGLLPWLILLLVPALRTWNLPAPTRFSHSGFLSEFDDDPDNDNSSTPWLDAIAARDPKDALLRAWVEKTRVGSPLGESPVPYGKLLQSFPNVPWLLAHRLRFAPRKTLLATDYGGYDSRVAEGQERQLLEARLAGKSMRRPEPTNDGPAIDLAPVYDPPVHTREMERAGPPAQPYHPPARVESDETYDSATGEEEVAAPVPYSAAPSFIAPSPTYSVLATPNYSVMAAELAWCERGARLDPDNAFWGVRRAGWLFALNRDAAALEAWHKASRLARYDDYSRQANLVAYRLPELVSPGSAIDRRSLGEGVYDREWSLRHLFQLATGCGTIAEARGDHAKALQIYAASMRLAALIRRQSFFAGEALKACAYEAIVWAGATRPVTWKEALVRKTPVNGEFWLTAGAAKFADYARSHGQPALAAEAVRQAAESARDRTQLQNSIAAHQRNGSWAVSAATAVRLLTLAQLWVLLLSQLAALALWRAVVWIISERSPRPATPAVPLETRARNILWCAVVAVPVATILFGQTADRQVLFGNGTISELPLIYLLLSLPFLVSLLLPAAGCAARVVSMEPKPERLLPVTGARFAAIVLVCGPLLCSGLAWGLLWFVSHGGSLPAGFGSLVSGSDLVLKVYILFNPATGCYLMGIGLAGLFWAMMMRRPGLHASARHAALAQHRQMLADWALLAAYGLILVSLLGSLANADANRQLDRFIEVGSHRWFMGQR